jgi:hypothetical protein
MTFESTTDVLKQTLAEVQRDEAEAIGLLVTLLDNVRQSSRTAMLEPICQVVKRWQDEPPRGIVTSLMKIADEFEAECPIRDKK